MSNRVVVVGGGAIGVAAAYYLSLSGWEVTVVERGEIGQGCSYANACLIVPSHSHPLPGPGVLSQVIRWMRMLESPVYVRPRADLDFLRWGWRFIRACGAGAAERANRALMELSRASLDLFEELVRASGLGFFYERKGLLHVYLTAAGLEAARAELDRLRAAGFEARFLFREEALAVEPALGPRVRGALFIEGEAHGDCYAYVRALAVRLKARGARLVTRRPALRVLVRGRRVEGVLVGDPEETIPADLVVLAAGAWSPGLAAPLGLRVPLQPARGYSCTIPAYPGAPSVPVFVDERRVAITPLGDRVRFGGTLELAGFDAGAGDVRRYQAVVNAARETLNDALRVREAEPWDGFRPLSPDALPIIGRAPGVDGLILATGHGTLGFTQSPATGRLVAELAGGQPTSVPLEPFRPDRF